MATYLYGIIRDSGITSLGLRGVGSGDQQVYVVGLEGIGGVVSDYSGTRWTELPLHELQRQREIHQQVIRAVVRKRPLLPARFGTLLPSMAVVRRAIRSEAWRLEQALQKFESLVAYEVTAVWEYGDILDEIVEEGDFRRLRAAAEAMSPVASLELRFSLGSRIKESLAKRQEELRHRLTSLLAEHVLDYQVKAAAVNEVTTLYLVPSSSQEEFLRQIQRAEAHFEGRARLRYLGPRSPYRFAAQIARSALDETRVDLRLLGLVPGTTVAVAGSTRSEEIAGETEAVGL